AKERRLDIIDATCPLVTKVHLEAVRFARDGFSIVLIGHRDHDEVIGTLGEVPERSYLVETLEDVDSLHVPDPSGQPPQGTFSADLGAAIPGYLLRYGKPPDGGEGDLRECGPAPGSGFPEQFQLQAPGGGGRQFWREFPPGERLWRRGCGLARWCEERRGYGGRVGPGAPGAGTPRVSSRKRVHGNGGELNNG